MAEEKAIRLLTPKVELPSQVKSLISETDVSGLAMAVEKGDITVLRSLLRSDKEKTDGISAKIGPLAYQIRKEEAWREWGYANFADFCREEVGRAHSTVTELINNYQFFCVERGYPLEIYLKASILMGWTLLREFRRVAIAREKFDILVADPPKMLDHTAMKEMVSGTEVVEIKWKTIHTRLVPDKYRMVMKAVEDLKQKGWTKDTGEALVILASRYWLSPLEKRGYG